MKFLKHNVHSILFLVGLAHISYGLFLYDLKIGFIGTGLLITFLGLYIDRTN